MGCGIVTEFMLKNNVSMIPDATKDISVDYIGAGVGVKQVTLTAGQQVIQHKHKYPHLSILIYGEVTLATDEFTKVLKGPTSVVIEAGIYHYVHALTDSLWLCVHGSEDMESLCCE